ncbi:MAG: AtpZ/AtpI family protein [Ancalomicrobiaceae bacterium]|nr:AtpZ/AtpI family protein [Ancalomicrobiaceae bacterium]
MTRQDDPESKSELAARRERLAERLATKVAQDKPAGNKANAGWGEATKIASEFVAGVVVGAALGWFFDRWLGTSPFGLIVFLLLGFAAGVLNVLRTQGVVAQAGAQLRGEGGQPKPDNGAGDGPDAGT